jgi:hypothetical protein
VQLFIKPKIVLWLNTMRNKFLQKILKQEVKVGEINNRAAVFAEIPPYNQQFRSFTLRGKSHKTQTTGINQTPFLARRPENGLGVFWICVFTLRADDRV